jgi:predicted homoserine dehydrogenase-like protein
MEGEKLRVGLLGVGAIAQVVHLPVLSQLEDVELVAVCDVDQPRARAIAARFGIPHVFGNDDTVFSPTTSTPSSSARPATCTRARPSPALQAASTCSSRSRSR